MTVIFYSEIKKSWDNEQLDKHLASLPHQMQQKIIAYQDKLEMQSRIIGKLLIKKQLAHFCLKQMTLEDLKYSPNNKPFFENKLQFSLSYSNGFVVCAASNKANIGIDIELIKPIDMSLMDDYFTSKEWGFLLLKNWDINYFYHLWTRKEAVLKVLGKGIFLDFNTIDVSNDIFIDNNKKYFLQNVQIKDSCKISLVTDNFSEMSTIKILELDF